MSTDKFWMIYSPDGGTPRVQHKTLDAAKKEAERLARHCQDQRFYLLESVGSAVSKSPPVQWELHKKPKGWK